MQRAFWIIARLNCLVKSKWSQMRTVNTHPAPQRTATGVVFTIAGRCQMRESVIGLQINSTPYSRLRAVRAVSRQQSARSPRRTGTSLTRTRPPVTWDAYRHVAIARVLRARYRRETDAGDRGL